ncbi:trypsin-like peptidase domain-containing protein [Psychrosphaera sp. 1_MG-2023]|uniref:trypsin-like peptidase domain-containing protein n=1 Tax=Psychrosphaera sp. 1_MG-2023 TaxID=3062643 RepID=UPI0026E2E0CA|nr:trypsin-like peptidase domain-containing protein [Psychrosphaera sp. 1_MG-2023]MDO6720985.1 trypsin-like peptidase domain-containing protein [Psychrosphaera sp. 1_MG-2023]
MLQKFRYIFNAIAYGLAAALVVITINPQLRSNLGITQFTDKVINQEAMSFANAVKLAAPAVVNIYSIVVNHSNFNQTQAINDLGSGVIMASNGHILTNYHVVDSAEIIYIDLQDGRRFSAEVIGLDEVTDLALLKIDATNLPTIPQDPDLEAQVGDIVLAIGNPLNYGQTITQGIISASGKRGLTPGPSHGDLIQMDAAINVGNSGGALVNSKGMLVGINTASAQSDRTGIQGIFFAIPYKQAKNIMDKLLADGEVKRGYLGLSGTAINQMGAPVRSSVESIAGIQITSVDPLGPAWASGLKANDVLLSVNGKQLISLSELLSFVENVEPGSIITFKLFRNGNLLNKDVEVGRLETSR